MKTSPILRHSIIGLLFALPHLEAAPDTLSGNSPAWAPGGNWSLGVRPGVGDNAVITATGLVNIDGGALVGSTEIQDLTLNNAGGVTLENGSFSTAMNLILNGGRGAGVPLIQTIGNAAYAIQSPGSNGLPLNLLLKASGDVSVGSTNTDLALTISGDIGESGGARNVRKTGTGRLILSGSNSFSGGVTISAGAVEATSDGALGTGAAVVNGGTLEINQAATTLTASSVTVNAGGQIALSNGSVLSNAVTLAGGSLTARATGTGVFEGPVNVTANSAVDLRSYTDLAQSLDVTIAGILSGNSALNLNGNASGGAALLLSNNGNTFSGNYNIGAGQTLRNAPLLNGKTIGTGTINLLGGTLDVRDSGTSTSQQLVYGNNVVVGVGGGSINVDRVSGLNTANTIQFNTLTIGAETLRFSGGNNYRARFNGATTLTGAATLNVGMSGTVAMQVFMNGSIAGAFDLTKTGAGILRLQTANTYSGNTNINGGSLILASTGTVTNSPRINIAAGAIFDVNSVTGGFKLGAAQTIAGGGNVSGPFTVLAGGTIQPGGATGTGTLTFTTLAFGLAGGDANNVNFASLLNSPKLTVSNSNGLVANGGLNSVTLNIGGGAPAVGTYTLVDYVGAIGGSGVGAFRLGSLPTRVLSAVLVPNAANTSIDLNVSATDFPIWKGALNNEWTATIQSAPKNWVLNSNNATTSDFLVDDNATFTDLATVTTVNIGTTDVSPGAVVFTNATKDYTITGSKAIVGLGGLSKSGAGKVTISNTNSFLGSVALNGGTISVPTIGNSGVAGPLGAGGSLTFGGGRLELTGAAASTNRAVSIGAGGATFSMASSLTLTGTVSGTGPLTIAAGTLEIANGGSISTGSITNNGTLRINQAGASNLNNAISGTGGLSIVGGGTITLGGVGNTYTGVTEITNATLIAAKGPNVTAIPGDLVINAGGTFRYQNNNVSNQVANTSSIFINGGIFGDPFTNAPTNPGATDTVANVTVNGGAFGSGRNVTLGAFNITGMLHILGGGVAVAQRAGIIAADTVQIDDGSANLDGGSTTAGSQSRLDVGPGGLTLAGGTINFNAGPSAVGGGSSGSIVRLGGDLVSTGLSQFVRQNPGVSSATVDLLGGTRVFNVEGTLNIGALDAPIDVANGIINKTGGGTLTIAGNQSYAGLIADDGSTILHTQMGVGDGFVTANANVDFLSDQTLGSLDIGPGGVVNLGGAPAAPSAIVSFAELASDGTAAIPEPGSWVLLCLGGFAALGRRKRF